MEQVILVAHGSPSDPGPPAAVLRDIAARVQALAPRFQIRAATLAQPGALEQAVSGCSAPWILPFFMAEGWFTRTELPRRLAALGLAGKARHLPPFGVDPDLPDLLRKETALAAQSAGILQESADLILVAHGSRVAGRSKDAALAMAQTLRATTPFWRVLPAFIEEEPFLADVAARSRGGLCLPFFALRAGHVVQDIPEALAQAGYRGHLMAAAGEHPEAAGLIARSLSRLPEQVFDGQPPGAGYKPA